MTYNVFGGTLNPALYILCTGVSYLLWQKKFTLPTWPRGVLWPRLSWLQDQNKSQSDDENTCRTQIL